MQWPIASRGFYGTGENAKLYQVAFEVEPLDARQSGIRKQYVEQNLRLALPVYRVPPWFASPVSECMAHHTLLFVAPLSMSRSITLQYIFSFPVACRHVMARPEGYHDHEQLFFFFSLSRSSSTSPVSSVTCTLQLSAGGSEADKAVQHELSL